MKKESNFLGLDTLRRYLATLNFGTMCLLGLCGVMGYNNFFLFENMLAAAGTPTEPWTIEITPDFIITLFSRAGLVSAIFSFFFSASIIFYQMRGKTDIVRFFLNFEKLAHIYYFVILVTFKDFDLAAFGITQADGSFWLDDVLKSPMLKWHSLIINTAYGLALPQAAKFFAAEMDEEKIDEQKANLEDKGETYFEELRPVKDHIPNVASNNIVAKSIVDGEEKQLSEIEKDSFTTAVEGDDKKN